jgi:hypothetical protein
LYLADKYFLCRHCYGLSYSSQNETNLDRAYRKRNKLQGRLGGKPCLKPKRMHQATFDKLRHRLIEAVLRADELFRLRASKFLTGTPSFREKY